MSMAMAMSASIKLPIAPGNALSALNETPVFEQKKNLTKRSGFFIR